MTPPPTTLKVVENIVAVVYIILIYLSKQINCPSVICLKHDALIGVRVDQTHPHRGCLAERRCILRTQSASSRQLLLMFGIPQYSERAITTHRLTHRSLFPIPYLPLALRNNPAELTSVGNCSMVASTDFPRQPHDFPAEAHI